MDNAGDWLYIVFLIIAGISSLFGSKNKKKRPKQILGQPDREIVTNEDNVPDKGFWEILEEMQNPKPVKQPVPTPKRKKKQQQVAAPSPFLAAEKAEELLFQAWETAGYHGQPDEDYYPRTAQETRDMEDLLTQAEAAIDDPSDTELMEVMADTREVLEWSKQRHWTFAWWIIICVAIMGCYYFYQAGSEQDYVAKRQALTDEQVQTELSEAITRQQSYIDTYSQKLAVDTISEETRSLYEKYMENATEEIKELKAYNVETYKKHLVDRADAGVWRERWEAIWCFIWIVLYIFACRPRGYMITKRRREDKMATGLKKILFGIAGALVGAAGALYVTTTITKWSDGSKTRDDDSMIIYAMKFGLIALAVIIVLWAARIVIVIATLLGLLRNYDWKQLAKDPKAMLNDLK